MSSHLCCVRDFSQMGGGARDVKGPSQFSSHQSQSTNFLITSLPFSPIASVY